MSTLEGGAWQAAGGYLEHLSDADLALLGSAAGSLPAERLRGDPAMVERLLDDPRTFQAVFGGTGRADPLLRASPFLVFALAIQRGAEDLREAAFVGEWAGPRQRLPVFDVATLRDFLAAPARPPRRAGRPAAPVAPGARRTTPASKTRTRSTPGSSGGGSRGRCGPGSRPSRAPP